MKLIDMANQDDIAKEIGQLTMHIANLEVMLVPILAELLEGNHVAAQIIILKIESVSVILSIVNELADAQRGSRFSDTVANAKKDILSAIAFRNKLSHGQYVFDAETGRFELLANALTDRRGPPKSTPLTVGMAAAHTKALILAVNKIIEAGDGRLRNPFDVRGPSDA